MNEQAESKMSPWKLVESADLPVAPGVEEVREKWLRQQVWCLTPWGQWRRGMVKYIGNEGSVAITVYQKGTVGIGLGCRIENISEVLRLVGDNGKPLANS